MREASAPAVTPKDLFSEALLKDPYPTYKKFLDEGSAHFVNFGPGMWAIFGHNDCSTAIRDPRLTAKRTRIFELSLQPEERGEFNELARLLGLWMLFIDAPEHSRLRKLMNKGFSPAIVDSLRPQVESVVDRLLVNLENSADKDVLKEVAYSLPLLVIAEMLGISNSMHDKLLEWTDAIALFFGNPRHTPENLRPPQKAILEITEFFRGEIAERRKNKGNDLISLLLDIEEDGDVLTEEELFAQCVMLLFGGHETTRNLVGNGVYTLLRHPEQLAELRENPGLIRSAVEELLRFESPVQYTARMAREEMEMCGALLRPGEPILFMLAAANRDPRVFREPDRLDLKRVSNPHLTFGAGAHFCIGNQLARLQGQVAILKLVQKFPGMKLADPSVEWVPNSILRGLKSLRVEL